MTTAPLQQYPARVGTTDKGREYEYLMTTWLALHSIQHAKDVRIASNVDGVGVWDDVILILTMENDDRFAFMLQLKHKEDQKVLTPKELLKPSSKLCLNTYCKDIVTLRNDLIRKPDEKEAITRDLGSFDNIYFVLFTNRIMDINNIKADKNSFLEIDQNDSQTSLLKTILNTSSGTECALKFVLSNIPPTISSEDGGNFSNFRLFFNQISVEHLEEEIAAEIGKIVPFDLLKTNEKTIVKEFMEYVQNWAKGDLGGHYYLTKNDISLKLTELYLSQYEVNLTSQQFENYDSDKNKNWNQLLLDKTVTIIDSDITVLNFLIQFISNEVEKYYKGFNGSWSDKLSEQDQLLFYHEHDNLQQIMLKIVGIRGKIRLIDIYKCIWMNNQIPLLLEIQNLKEYENILKILKLSNYSRNVIILSGASATLPKHENTETFQTLQDLNEEKREMVLNQPAELQGRLLSKLGDLLDDTMFEDIKCNDIVSILSGTFSIGEKVKSLPQFFIHRNTTKIFIKSQVFHSIFDEVFLLNHCEKNYFDSLPKGSNLIIPAENHDNAEQIEKLKVSNRNIHNSYVYNDNYLEWKWTFGSTQKIRPFKVHLKDMFESDISYYFSNHTNIISEVPGMGKSVLLDYIAHKAPTSKWVLRIDLSGHLKYYRSNDCKNPNTKASKHLNYFFSVQDKDNNELAKKVFQKQLKIKGIMVLLDGFDEISIFYKTEVTNIANSLQKEGYDVWLTTRPHMQNHLEEEFNTFAISLQPFTVDNQRTFLAAYFSDKNRDLAMNRERRIEEFVEGLLVATKNNLYDYEAKFTGIPLQTELLAAYFNKKCRNCLSDSVAISFNEKFDLLHLYQNFINKKLEELCKKFGESALETTEKVRKHQPLLALQLVFRLEDFEEVHVIKKVDDYYKKKPDKKQNLQKDGIITVDEKLNINCTHRTFAEYLAAQWLAENLQTTDEQLQEFVHDLIKQRFTKNYQFLFNIFDRILVQNCDIHMAIINGQFDKAIKMINSNSVTLPDKGGRTILHILALYDDEDLLSNNKNSNILQILEKIPNARKLCSIRDVLGYTALDYALANNSSMILANALCEHPSISPINAYIDLNSCWLYLSKCEEFGLRTLFDLLLPYFTSRDLLQHKIVNTSTNMKSYVRSKSFDRKSEYVKDLVSMTILEFMQSKRGWAYSGYAKALNNYSDVRYAIRFGDERNVEEVLSKCNEINKKDVDNNTPLHYAVLNQKLEIIEMLLSNGANVNKKNFNNQSPLHLAFMKRNFDIIDLLLSQNPNFNAIDKKGQNYLHYAVNYGDYDMVKELIGKVDINKQDNDGNIPLHLALQENRMDIAELLIDNSSDVKILNNKNSNSLHYAVLYGCTNVINKPLFKTVDKNVQDMEGNTPLHLELIKNSVDVNTVKFLIDTGTDVNVQNVRKETPLHLLLNNPDSVNNTLVELLYHHGADVNLKNNSDESAIHCAIRSRNITVVPMLLPNFQDVNQRDCYGNTCLHLASRNGESEIVKSLISRKASVNLKNTEGETPLHLATISGNTDILTTILSVEGVEIDKKDNKGNTALHLAIKDNNIATVKLLISKDANVKIRNRGKTSLDLAHKSGNKEMIALLSRHVKNDSKPPFYKKGFSNYRGPPKKAI